MQADMIADNRIAELAEQDDDILKGLPETIIKIRKACAADKMQ